MWTRGLLKQNARVAFHRNYFACMMVCLITSFLGGEVVRYSYNVGVNETETTYQYATYEEMLEQIKTLLMQISPMMWTIILMAVVVGTVAGFAIVLMVSNVVTVGCNRYFLENREHQTGIAKVFHGFQGGRYSTTVWIMFLRNLYIWAWSLLFWIPGIIKSYSYMLVPYILAENTYLDRRRVFELSREMMRGHKWEAFVLQLSFIGWHLIGLVSGGLVGIFYVSPYISATNAEFYSAIKAEAQMKGIFAPHELPGVAEPDII